MAPRHRLFFAVRPPELEGRLIGCVRDRQKGFTSEVTNDRFHGTMGITEDFDAFPERLADRMIAIGNAVSAEPAGIVLDRLSGGARSLALRPARLLKGIADLGRQLQAPMQRAGMLRPGWEFSFHVTLGYREGRPFSAQVDPIEWRCTEFVLIHSIVGRTRHIELARWPLAVRQYGLFD